VKRQLSQKKKNIRKGWDTLVTRHAMPFLAGQT
jgi:hypothetical protein